jgi:hypothetical protein
MPKALIVVVSDLYLPSALVLVGIFVMLGFYTVGNQYDGDLTVLAMIAVIIVTAIGLALAPNATRRICSNDWLVRWIVRRKWGKS